MGYLDWPMHSDFRDVAGGLGKGQGGLDRRQDAVARLDGAEVGSRLTGGGRGCGRGGAACSTDNTARSRRTLRAETARRIEPK